MTFSDFFDLKALHAEIAPSLLKNIDGQESKISDVRLLHFEKGREVFYYKTSFKQQEWDTVDFKPKKRRNVEVQPIKEIVIKPACTKKITLSDNKKKDFKSLVDGIIVPGFYKHFFDSVIC